MVVTCSYISSTQGLIKHHLDYKESTQLQATDEGLFNISGAKLVWHMVAWFSMGVLGDVGSILAITRPCVLARSGAVESDKA